MKVEVNVLGSRPNKPPVSVDVKQHFNNSITLKIELYENYICNTNYSSITLKIELYENFIYVTLTTVPSH